MLLGKLDPMTKMQFVSLFCLALYGARGENASEVFSACIAAVGMYCGGFEMGGWMADWIARRPKRKSTGPTGAKE